MDITTSRVWFENLGQERLWKCDSITYPSANGIKGWGRIKESFPDENILAIDSGP